ncbi:unnamed protein product [Lampetra fluviatilis]
MAAASSKAVLKRILTKYKHKDVALKDVVAVTEIFPNLIPSQDTYSCVYNIPVELWLLDSHPAHPPLCFVRPTASMMIRTSRRVDSNGRVYLPCLSQWGAASDLLVLVQVMCAEFGEEPPVLSLGRGRSGRLCAGEARRRRAGLVPSSQLSSAHTASSAGGENACSSC